MWGNKTINIYVGNDQINSANVSVRFVSWTSEESLNKKEKYAKEVAQISSE